MYRLSPLLNYKIILNAESFKKKAFEATTKAKFLIVIIKFSKKSLLTMKKLHIIIVKRDLQLPI